MVFLSVQLAPRSLPPRTWGQWRTPPSGTIKINFDGAIFTKERKSGIGAAWCPWFGAGLSISATVTGLQSTGDRSKGSVIKSLVYCRFGIQSGDHRRRFSGSYDSTNQQQFAYCFCPLIVCLLMMMYDLALDFFLNYVTLI